MTNAIGTHIKADRVMAGGDFDRKLSIVHLAVILAGAALFMANAFNSNVWYDETYSVALVWHSFDEIWRIGALDVHPVLFYFVLRLLYMVFGTNIIAYRVFCVLGTIVLSFIGWTHIRHDAGQRTAILFSALAYLLPWSVRIAFQIRMYSWLAVVMMLLAIYAWRILRETATNAGSDNPLSIPMRWWVYSFVLSIASAYLHYYGAMAAFAVQAILLASLIKYKAGKKYILIWEIGAAISVVCYLPWIAAAFSQASGVSGDSYWIKFEYSRTTGELTMFPFNTPELEREAIGNFTMTAVIVILTTAVAALGAASLYSYGKAMGGDAGKNDQSRLDGAGIVLRSPASFSIAILAITAAIAMAASLLIGGAVLYYRYLVVCIGPLALAMAYVFARTDNRKLGYTAFAFCIACGLMSYHSLYETSHSSLNEETLSMYEDACAQARELNGGEDPLVVGTSVYTDGILATEGVGEPITYIPEWVNPAYEAYEPRFIRGKTFDDALGDYHGAMVFLGNEENARKLADEYGGEIVSHSYSLHMYSGLWFDFTVMKFD